MLVLPKILTLFRALHNLKAFSAILNLLNGRLKIHKISFSELKTGTPRIELLRLRS